MSLVGQQYQQHATTRTAACHQLWLKYPKPQTCAFPINAQSEIYSKKKFTVVFCNVAFEYLKEVCEILIAFLSTKFIRTRDGISIKLNTNMKSEQFNLHQNSVNVLVLSQQKQRKNVLLSLKSCKHGNLFYMFIDDNIQCSR